MRLERNLGATFSQHVHASASDGALRLIIPASEWSVRCGLQSIRYGLERLSLSDDALSNVELVIAELLNNIVEHAYKDRVDGMIEVELLFIGNSILCKVTDDGLPMPNGQIPPGQPKDLSGDLEDLPEGGFGWLLIRELTQDLHYGRHDNRNMLSCSIRVKNT